MRLSADQLTKIHISGYKSIKDSSINLNKINVLIGSNGAGKSNFISAFALLQNILAKNFQVAAGGKMEFILFLTMLERQLKKLALVGIHLNRLYSLTSY